MNTAKIMFGAVIGVVVAAVIVGLVISGSPAEQRLLREDRQRVSDLRSISASIERYYRSTESLPEDFSVLLNGWAAAGIPRDPVTGDDYEYTIEAGKAFRLCADFAREADETDRRQEFWSHGSGRQCFEFDFSDLRPY